MASTCHQRHQTSFIKNLTFGTKVSQFNHKDLTIDIHITSHISHHSCQQYDV
jgi:hypothetical protein